MKAIAYSILRRLLAIRTETFMWSLIGLCFAMLMVCLIRGGN